MIYNISLYIIVNLFKFIGCWTPVESLEFANWFALVYFLGLRQRDSPRSLGIVPKMGRIHCLPASNSVWCSALSTTSNWISFHYFSPILFCASFPIFNPTPPKGTFTWCPPTCICIVNIVIAINWASISHSPNSSHLTVTKLHILWHLQHNCHSLLTMSQVHRRVQQLIIFFSF